MKNRHLKSIALFSGSFFLLLLLFSTQLYAVAGSFSSTGKAIGAAAVSAGTGIHFVHNGSRSSAADRPTQHSRMNGKAGHNDKRHFETDLFAGANKAGAPAASQARISE